MCGCSLPNLTDLKTAMPWAILPCVTATSLGFALHLISSALAITQWEYSHFTKQGNQRSDWTLPRVAKLYHWNLRFFFFSFKLLYCLVLKTLKICCVYELDKLDFLHYQRTYPYILWAVGAVSALVLCVNQNHITLKYKAASLVMWPRLGSCWQSAADLTMEREEYHVQLKWQRKIEYAGCWAGTSRNESMRVIGNKQIYCWTSILTLELHNSE